jgi:uncharacterized protein (DUF1697 family)
MSVNVILLRGVNVSGANRLPMAEFRTMLKALGFGNVQTYIQSGNAVVNSDWPPAKIAAAVGQEIATRFGFSPEVFVVSPDEITSAINDHPFADAAPEKVHVFFLKETPDGLDAAAMRSLAVEGDGWVLAPGRFTLHTPAGIGRSKLAEKLHRFLPGPMTARNLRTIAALHSMIVAAG